MKHMKRLGLVLAAALLLAAFPVTALAEEAAVVEAETLTEGQILKAGTVLKITDVGEKGSKELKLTTETSGNTPSIPTEGAKEDVNSTEDVVYTLNEDFVVCAVQTGITTTTMTSKVNPSDELALIFSEVRHDSVDSLPEGDQEVSATGKVCYLINGKFVEQDATLTYRRQSTDVWRYEDYSTVYNGIEYSRKGYFLETYKAVWVYLQPLETEPVPDSKPESSFTEPVYYPDYGEEESAPGEPEQAAPSREYAVICRTLNVRATPATQLPRIARVYRGDTLRVLEVLDNGWARIEWTGGPDGCAYVSAKYIQAAH